MRADEVAVSVVELGDRAEHLDVVVDQVVAAIDEAGNVPDHLEVPFADDLRRPGCNRRDGSYRQRGGGDQAEPESGACGGAHRYLPGPSPRAAS